jgi:hypothetical protein
MRAEDIEAAYQRRLLAYPEARWGWSFMYTREADLAHAKVALVGLNPGGGPKDEPRSWEAEEINAYIDQRWSNGGGLSPLQVQVGLLFEALGVQKNEVFAANFIPFRSPSWSQLPDQEGALDFGRCLWTNILTRSPRPPFRLFVSLGKQSGRELATLLKACFVRQHSVEWESQKIDEYVAADGRTVLALPHLSRFRIFGAKRTSAAAAVGEIAQRVLR